MITVIIHAVMFEKEYEFRLDPDVKISDLIDEIGEMICQREQYELKGNTSELMMFVKEKHQIFPRYATLRECNVKTGDLLYFG